MVSFKRDRKAIMSVDGQDCPSYRGNQAFPQGSPISPVLFVIHIAEDHQPAVRQVNGCRGFSFVDGVTWK